MKGELMDSLKQRLSTMMDFWIDHNREHEQELREWAGMASSLGEAVGQELLMAAASLAEASVCLERARQVMREKSG